MTEFPGETDKLLKGLGFSPKGCRRLEFLKFLVRRGELGGENDGTGYRVSGQISFKEKAGENIAARLLGLSQRVITALQADPEAGSILRQDGTRFFFRELKRGAGGELRRLVMETDPLTLHRLLLSQEIEHRDNPFFFGKEIGHVVEIIDFATPRVILTRHCLDKRGQRYRGSWQVICAGFSSVSYLNERDEIILRETAGALEEYLRVSTSQKSPDSLGGQNNTNPAKT